MKHSFSRLFGIGEKEEEEAELFAEETNKEEIQEIEVDAIVPNRFQPRTIFSDEKINELATTIHTHGIIQPIVVRKTEDQSTYEIIAGERRWRAVKSLGWDKISAIVKNFSDTETASVALIENLQREELSSIEEAHAYAKLLELHDLTQEALAQRLGKGQSTVANKLRLLKLPEEVQQAILQKKITERHARALIPLKAPELQLKLLEEMVEKNLNVKQTEDRVVKMLEQDKRKPKPRRKAFSRDTRIAMNTIRQSLSMVEDSGVKLNTEEEEFEEYIQLTIRIPKK
ncbi:MULTISPECIES: nucleoid occlusion protein [Bacillus]|uniref:Nucleoid occlusion protein n=2 Tax=Bacillus TaxID=1386 RepID=A0A0M5JJG7_9BACI|nr:MULTISPECIES: nucleoid occlusion protein [Bacillus]ALC83194.1 chromosome partitioning protein ParB [Bacillus gobiensis]MBP1082281.1 ParB family chromosome partitioning protein [Bacillus capparidis]MED1096886.1 nucleoid occlusion protein [Bacillus capparidis]